MADGDDADEVFRRRGFVERNVARLAVRDDGFPQCGAGAGQAGDPGACIKDEYGAAYCLKMRQGGGRVALIVEFENLLRNSINPRIVADIAARRKM